MIGQWCEHCQAAAAGCGHPAPAGSPAAPVWSRAVGPADDIAGFLADHLAGLHDDPAGEPTPAAWLGRGAPVMGDGWDPHPLLAAPGAHGRESCTMSGLIRDGRGVHSHAAAAWGHR